MELLPHYIFFLLLTIYYASDSMLHEVIHVVVVQKVLYFCPTSTGYCNNFAMFHLRGQFLPFFTL